MQAPCWWRRRHLAVCNFVLEARKKYYTAKQFSERDPGHQEEWTMCVLDHIHQGNSNSSNVLLCFQNQWEECVSLYHSFIFRAHGSTEPYVPECMGGREPPWCLLLPTSKTFYATMTRRSPTHSAGCYDAILSPYQVCGTTWSEEILTHNHIVNENSQK